MHSRAASKGKNMDMKGGCNQQYGGRIAEGPDRIAR
jgi:hypothetical protein